MRVYGKQEPAHGTRASPGRYGAGGDFFAGTSGGKGGAPARGAAAPPPRSAADPVDYNKYGSAKSISSDAYFGKSAGEDAAAQQELRKYTGASSISSADYFGDGASGGGGRGGGGGGGGDADELMGRLRLQVEQEMRQVRSYASEAGRKVNDLLANLNR